MSAARALEPQAQAAPHLDAQEVADAQAMLRMSDRLAWKLVALASVLVIAAIACLSIYAIQVFERGLTPEVAAKLTAIADDAADDFSRAASLGIPLDKLPGVADYLDTVRASHGELRYVALVDGQGRLIHGRGSLPRAYPANAAAGQLVANGADLDLAAPLKDGAGAVHLGVDGRLVETLHNEILYDTLITMFVAVLVALEVLFLLTAVTVSRSLSLLVRLVERVGSGDFSHVVARRSRDEIGRLIAAANRLVLRVHERGPAAQAPRPIVASRAGDVRLPLFVFFFAIELGRPFFPVYVQSLYTPIPWLSEQTAIALPMTLWVVVMLIATPYGSALDRRFGARQVLIAGMVPAAIGSAMVGLASSFWELLFWRCVVAAGFGLVTVAGLTFVALAAETGKRARGMSVFVGASTAASVCGTAIGGILADRIGYSATFLVAAGVIAFALFLTTVLLDADQSGSDAAKKKVTWAQFAGILLAGRVLLVVLFSAVPARLMLTGFLFYMSPLYLTELGYSESEIGRFMMSYFLCMLVVSPLVSTLADRFGTHRLLMLAGGLASAAGALAYGMGHSLWLLLGGTILVGLGQAMVTTPQLALIPDLFREQCERYGLSTVIAVFRIVERIGSIAGPLVMAALATALGFAEASSILGWIMLGATAMLAVSLALAGRRAEPRLA
ncbi:MFS transporter [Zavarzinia sp. CC-PAN008]|uniref:MFS transporter n=1 Tax=Zavarzinia sp. CC-PAN008 TaxID=3243332 RepID=UPI003F74335B